MFCGWAMLRTMGAERERRLQEQRHATPPPTPPTAPTPLPPPSKWNLKSKNAPNAARRQAA
jgi:hypothetical protein